MENQKKQLVKFENVADKVMARIKEMESVDMIRIPGNYSVENALKSAWLMLQETSDRNGKKALQVCTSESVANSMLDMVLQGLSVAKKQGYFIVYGNQLQFQRSYFGTTALAMRTGLIKTIPVANVIYEGDEFVYRISPDTGNIVIVKHEQKLDNIDNGKIKAAYAIVQLSNGETRVTIMTKAQIEKAWNQGATKGKSPAHQNFAEEMSKKTVIGRACKMIINSADDGWLYEGYRDEFDRTASERRDAEIESLANKEEFNEAEEVVDTEQAQEKPQDEPKQQGKVVNKETGELFPSEEEKASGEDLPY